MAWLNPTYLWLLIAAPVVGLLLWRASWLRRKALRAFGTPDLLDRLTGGRRSLRSVKGLLLFVALAMLGLALAGPRVGTRLREVRREGVDLVIALDVSESMLARDVAPSRLDRARYEIRRLLDELEGGSRVGLVIFAGEAFVQCPLTTDFNAFRMFLDVAGPGLVPTPGTDFVQAFRMSLRAFERQEKRGTTNSRALLILSDGENHTPGLPGAIEEVRKAGIVVYAAGIGDAGGAPVPVLADGEAVGQKRDRRGVPVVSHLDENTLRLVAESGAYFRLGRSSGSLATLPDLLGRLEQNTLEVDRFEDYREQYQWPLALGLILLALELLLPDFRSKARLRNGEEVA